MHYILFSRFTLILCTELSCKFCSFCISVAIGLAVRRLKQNVFLKVCSKERMPCVFQNSITITLATDSVVGSA
jgi:hypothetical protein